MFTQGHVDIVFRTVVRDKARQRGSGVDNGAEVRRNGGHKEGGRGEGTSSNLHIYFISVRYMRVYNHNTVVALGC